MQQSVQDRWDMKSDEIACLLSCNSADLDQWIANIQQDTSLELPADIQERIGCLFRLDCILSIVMPAEQRFRAFVQPTTTDSLFSGRSIKDHLLADPQTKRFYQVCDHLQGHVILGRPLTLKSLPDKQT